jgi:hypothetical protein
VDRYLLEEDRMRAGLPKRGVARGFQPAQPLCKRPQPRNPAASLVPLRQIDLAAQQALYGRKPALGVAAGRSNFDRAAIVRANGKQLAARRIAQRAIVRAVLADDVDNVARETPQRIDGQVESKRRRNGEQPRRTETLPSRI